MKKDKDPKWEDAYNDYDEYHTAFWIYDNIITNYILR